MRNKQASNTTESYGNAIYDITFSPLVHLFVCEQYPTKITEWISMEIGGRMHYTNHILVWVWTRGQI